MRTVYNFPKPFCVFQLFHWKTAMLTLASLKINQNEVSYFPWNRVFELFRLSMLALHTCLRVKWDGASASECNVKILIWGSKAILITPPQNRGGVIFSLQFVCVRLISCEQNSSRTDWQISTRFLLNGCLLQWLEPYWNWWPWVKCQGHCDQKCM